MINGAQRVWKSRNKTDLAIEVWERLDCESVGAAEIEAIETVILDVFGESAVDSPMATARLLADEGAELRHPEIMALYLERTAERAYSFVFEELLNATDFDAVLQLIRNMEKLHKTLSEDGDREGLRSLTDELLNTKRKMLEISGRVPTEERLRREEVAQWITIWLQSPDLFDNRVRLRRASADFRSRFS